MILLKRDIIFRPLPGVYPRFWLYTGELPHPDTQYIRWVMHADIDFDQSHVYEWSIKELYKRFNIRNEKLNIYTDYMSDTISCILNETIP